MPPPPVTSFTSSPPRGTPAPSLYSPHHHRGGDGCPAARCWPRLSLITLAVLAVGTTLALVDGSEDTPVVEVPALPSTVGPIALTGDPRAADPCALIDTGPLRQFGRPDITISFLLEGCQSRIATPNGDVHLDVFFDIPVTSVADLEGRPQHLGDLTIVRQGTVPQGEIVSCQNVLVLADRTQIFIRADNADRPSPDLCAITEVGTVTAVNALARDGISYRPDRTSRWLIAGSDACAVLDASELSKVAGLDSNIRLLGFANWSCTWGDYYGTAGSPRVYLLLRLDVANPGEYGEPTTIAGRRAWLETIAGINNPEQCSAYVVHRPAPSATAAIEMFSITVDAPAPREDLCARATELAAAAVAKLPS